MIKVIGWRADENEQKQIIELKNALSIKADSQIIRTAVAELHKKIFHRPNDISINSISLPDYNLGKSPLLIDKSADKSSAEE